MKEAALILDALRLAQGISQLIANYASTASTEQIKALVAEAHARGEEIDLTSVDSAIAQMNASGVALDAAIKAANPPSA